MKKLLDANAILHFLLSDNEKGNGDICRFFSGFC